jgi:uncharacterized integral membrane protein
MKVLKWLTGGLLLAIGALFIYENLATFSSRVHFNLDLFIHEAFSWSHPLYAIILMSAGLGLFLGLLLLLRPLLRLRRSLAQVAGEREECLTKLREQAERHATAPLPQDPAATDSTGVGSS